jgi:VIT1/CCC1 family predicted Fe2+/Mn2+ transporter
VAAGVTASRSRFLRPAIMGSADGVTIVLGLLVSLTGQPHALFHAALGAGLAELVGMTAGQWLSDGEGGFWPALANGGAACLACIVPALPYLTASGIAAMAVSLVLVAAVAALISWLRPERGILAVVQTYGILLAAAVLCAAVSLI